MPKQCREVAVVNRLGLHGRACAQVVLHAARFRANVSLIVAGRRASARSIVAVMMLAASVGATVRLEAEGPDAAAAVDAIATLFDQGFGERA
jgi:phosphocarrier protein